MAKGLKESRAHFCQLLNKDAAFERFDLDALFAGGEGLGAFLIAWEYRNNSDVTSQQRMQQQQALHHWYAKQLHIRNAFAQALSALNTKDVPVIAMRGIAVSEPYYGEQAVLRPQGDIDLLLKGDSLKASQDARQVLWDIGFRPNEKYPNVFLRGDVQIDLHTEPLGVDRIQAWEYLTPLRAPDFFKYTEKGELAGEEALLVHPRVNLPYLCFHAMKHSFERLIWLYDIALLANRVAQDGQWDEVFAGIAEYRLERPCYYALSYAKAHLNADVPADQLESIRPKMGFVERRLFARHMRHEVIPFLAERLFARMQPDFSHRIEFWRETIYPRYEVRQQMVSSGCVKCNFIRKRLKQLAQAAWLFAKEGFHLLKV